MRSTARSTTTTSLLAIALALVGCEDDDGASARRKLREERAAWARERAELVARQERLEAELAEIQERKRSGLKVTLPQGSSTDVDPTLTSLIVVVPAAGPVVVGGRSMTDAELETAFRAAFARDSKTQVVIQSETGAPHGRVVAVMELAKAAGLTRLAIGTSAH